MEKTGLMIPEETDSKYAHFGTVLERIVRKEFIQRTGIKVRVKKCMFQHPDYTYMLADVDGVIYNKEEGLCIFEAKTASAYKWNVWESGVPEEYQLQVQHYMAVTGANRAYVAALVGGNRFIYHVVERDEELIGLIIKMEKQFWEQHVQKQIPPALDGSSATSDYLNEKYKNSEKTVIELPKESETLLHTYDDLSEQIKALNMKKEEITNKLKEYLKENEQGVINDRVVKWSLVQKHQLDQKRLRSEKKEINDRYLTENSYRRFTVA